MLTLEVASDKGGADPPGNGVTAPVGVCSGGQRDSAGGMDVVRKLSGNGPVHQYRHSEWDSHSGAVVIHLAGVCGERLRVFDWDAFLWNAKG